MTKIFPRQNPRHVETQDLSKIDAISGATIFYNQFVETTNRTVEKTGK
ncbi:MAG: FMN-binding protein [Selenomonadaceae bacterium]|nr:FMN-binding protein [Selenomonadaceae bacterium]MBR4382835.1 FMN-binding protein [Selenomonadaceae bacterium]